MAEKKTQTEKKVASAMHEVFHDVPKTVKATGKTGKAKRKMQVAIALSKARAAGAHIPKKGGSTTLSANSMKYEALKGRKENLAHKAAWAAGGCRAGEE